MIRKRYAIVRVDNKCPCDFEKIDNLNVCAEPLRYYMNKSVNCKKCRYGDTKEQLVKKIAQPLFQREIELWYEHFPDEKPDKEITKTLYKNCLKQATKIVEFLGVENDK